VVLYGAWLAREKEGTEATSVVAEGWREVGAEGLARFTGAE
jgi:hypothetical protein